MSLSSFVEFIPISHVSIGFFFYLHDNMYLTVITIPSGSHILILSTHSFWEIKTMSNTSFPLVASTTF